MNKFLNKLINGKTVTNSTSQYPKIFYARHIGEGVVRYLNAEGGEDILFISNDTLKKMNASFAGKPVYINHRDVPLSQMKENAAGYVVESFYLPEDGKQWLKMIITDDEAFRVISEGCAVSNAYNVKEFGQGGQWHNLEYKSEVLDGEYEHLALVDDPRYEEAEIMTPEEFKSYKEAKKKELEAMSLQNSKDVKNQKENKTMFFTRKEVKETDGVDLKDIEVQLSNGTSMKIGDIVKVVEAKQNEAAIENKTIMVNGKEMKVSELISAFEALNSKKNEDDEDKDKEEKDNEEEKEEKGNKKNGCDEEDKMNEADEEEKEDEEEKKEDKKNSKSSDFERLMNASGNSKSEVLTVSTAETRLARGKELYGSK